jgi:multiple RNA-binding domain-containing protein 1
MCHAWVAYGIPECALKAAAALDGKVFHGRILHILSFQKNFPQAKKTKGGEFLFLKFKKFKNNCEKGGSLHQRSWYTLFLPKETVLKSLFLKYGKSQKVGASYEKIGLDLRKFALTEARIQNEVGLILKYIGINAAAFNPYLLHKKSRRTLLLKTHTPKPLVNPKKSLKKFGKIKKFIVLPLAHFILVEYQKKKDAARAFGHFEKNPTHETSIFIEWAPLNAIQDLHRMPKVKKPTLPPGGLPEEWLLFKKGSADLTAETPHRKNLLPTRAFAPATETSKKWLTASQTQKTISPPGKNGGNSGKILIRNLPFELTLYELKKIYEEYGTLLSLRLPKKLSGQPKGFAFVEFRSLEEAKKAVLSTQNVHIFSRHLVVQLLIKK